MFLCEWGVDILDCAHPFCFRIVSTYLVHHGYCSTAESFCKATSQPIDEDISSIKHRQRKFQEFVFLM